MKVKAYAKVNLFLEILGRRPDGYHELSTLFQNINLWDEIEIQVHNRPAVELHVEGVSIPPGKENLVFSAAHLLQKTLRENRGVSLILKKHIPMGAGLGGGSADAAATLMACAKLWRPRGVSRALLARLARRLGADVPFFLKGGTCLARGIGEKLTPLRGASPTWMILVYPRFQIPTAWVYKHLQSSSLTTPHPIHKIKHLLSSGARGERWAPELFNRLEEVVIPQFPIIQKIKTLLMSHGCRGALMSGSGSSLFGVVKSRQEGERVRQMLRRHSWDVWLVRTRCAGPGYSLLP